MNRPIATSSRPRGSSIGRLRKASRMSSFFPSAGSLWPAALLLIALCMPFSAVAQTETLVTDYDGGGILSNIDAFDITATDTGTELSLTGTDVGGSGQFPGVAHILNSATDFSQTPVVVVRMKVESSSNGPAIIRTALNQAGDPDLPDANSSADALIAEVPADGQYRDYYFDFTGLFVQFDGQTVDATNIGEVVFLVNDDAALGFLGQSGTFTGEIVVDRVARRADVPGGGGGGDDNGATFIGDDNGDGILVADTFEDYTVGDPIGGTGQPYFVFADNGATLDNLTVSNDVPQGGTSSISTNNTTKALEATISGGDGNGFAGFGKGVNSEADSVGFDVSGLGNDPFLTMYFQSNATTEYGLIVELQEDTDGDGAFEGGTEDNFRFTYTVDPNTSGYEFLSIQLSQITAFNNADDGVLDPQRVGNIVFLIAGDQAGLPAETFTLNVDDLGFTDDGSPLPVELAGFDARLDGRDAVLSWQTLSETNNAGFDVQVASGEADFLTVGSTDGAGTTTEPQRYTFRVPNLDPGVHRFRLRQVDVDGTTTLSEVQMLTIGSTTPFTMIQNTANPVQRGQTAHMKFMVGDREPVQATLYNVLGQRLRTLFDDTATPGAVTPMTIRTDDLASGVYFIRITGRSFSRTEQISVVR